MSDRSEFTKRLGASFRDVIARRSGRFVEIDGNQMAFTVDKTRLDGATFSQEALDGACDHIRSYVWSRVWRAYAASDFQEPPAHLRILVTVDTGTEPQLPATGDPIGTTYLGDKP